MSSAATFLEKLGAKREKQWNSFFTKWESIDPDDGKDETFSVLDDEDWTVERPHTSDAGWFTDTSRVGSRKVRYSEVWGSISEERNLSNGVISSKIPSTLACQSCNVDTKLPEGWLLRKISSISIKDHLCIDCMTKMSGHEDCDLDECSTCIGIAWEDKTREEYFERYKTKLKEKSTVKSIPVKRITLPSPAEGKDANGSLKQIQHEAPIFQIDTEASRIRINSPLKRPSSKESTLLEFDKSITGPSSLSESNVTDKEDDDRLSTTSSNLFSTPRLKKSFFKSDFDTLQTDGPDENVLCSPNGSSISSYNEKENYSKLSNFGNKELKESTYLKVDTPKSQSSCRYDSISNSSIGGSARKRFVITRRQT